MSQIDKTLCITINTSLMCVQVFSKSTFLNRHPPTWSEEAVFLFSSPLTSHVTVKPEAAVSACVTSLYALSLQVRFLLTIGGLLSLETKYNIHNITIVITLYLSVN